MSAETNAGWKAHALGQALPVDASDEFTFGWLQRKKQMRPVLIWAEPGADPDYLARIADAIDL